MRGTLYYQATSSSLESWTWEEEDADAGVSLGTGIHLPLYVYLDRLVRLQVNQTSADAYIYCLCNNYWATY